MTTPSLCPHCGQVHPPKTRFCPVTGRQLPTVPAPAPQNWLWLLFGLVGAGIVIMGGYLVFKSTPLGIFAQLNFPVPSASEPSLPVDTATSAATIPPPSPPTPSETPPPPPTDTSIPTSTPTPSPTLTAPPTQTQPPTWTPTPTAIPLTGKLTGKIAFTCQIFRNADRNQICIINADGTGWFRLTTRDSTDYNYPAFAPDGNSVIYSANLAGSYDLFESDLNGHERQITDLPGEEYSSAISPDGQQLAFTYNDGAHQTIWLTDRAGNHPHPITNGNNLEAWDPTWSPDGSQILFASGSIGNIQLLLMDADGTNIRQVTSLPNLRGRSSWSPDGLMLATYQGTTWHREIILFDLNGQHVQQITTGGNNLAPSFSPYGGWLAFTSYQDNFGSDHGCEIYVIRTDGSESMRLTNNDYCDWQPSWGP